MHARAITLAVFVAGAWSMAAAQSVAPGAWDPERSGFVENAGHYPACVRFATKVEGARVFVLRDGRVRYAVRDGEGSGMAVDLRPVGGNGDLVVRGREPTETAVTVFRAQGSMSTGVWKSVVVEAAWPGVDAVYRRVGGRLKYDLVVRPTGRVDSVRIAVEGADACRITESGALSIVAGAVRIVDTAPVAWQEIRGKRVPVEVRAVIRERAAGRVTYAFCTGEYEEGTDLVIDPTVMVFSSYLGGNAFDSVQGCSVGSDGSLYVCGATTSSTATFPLAAGPYVVKGGGTDAFVAKLSPAGQVVYCGYLAGSVVDTAECVAVDGTGAAYVAGKTGSLDFPAIAGPSVAHRGGTYDAFVAKVDPSGTKLVYCGFIGGIGSDTAVSIDVDASGSAYVAGNTNSDEATFPVRVGPVLTHGGGNQDGYVAKVNVSGRSLDYCGYVAGSAHEACTGIAVDRFGAAYVAGSTQSTEATFPVKNGPDVTYNGNTDAFVARVNPSGTSFDFCGYIGGTQGDGAGGIALDAAGSAYVVGGTISDETSFPLLVGPGLKYQGAADVFVARVLSNGALSYAGYIGGTGRDEAYGVAVENGRAYVVGKTVSDERSFPVRYGPDLTYNDDGTKGDGYIARVDASGASLDFCGYIGGAEEDIVRGVDIDPRGNVYLAGHTKSDETTFPVVVGPDLTFNDTTANLLGDGFVVKMGVVWLTASGSGRIGGSVGLGLSASHTSNVAYQLASSFGSGPIPLGSTRIWLSLDGLFALSTSGVWGSVFGGYSGTLDSAGKANATLNLPNIPALVGQRIYTAFALIANGAIDSVSQSANFVVQP